MERTFSFGKDILLIGDSTVRCLQPDPGSFDPDPRIANLGVGGARVETWKYAFRRALRSENKFRSVVFAMSGGGQSLESALALSPIVPFLMEWKELFEEVRNGRIRFSELPRILVSFLSPLSLFNDEAIYMIGRAWNQELGLFLQSVMFGNGPQSLGAIQADREADLKAILAFAAENRVKVTFVNSPSSTAVRATSMAKGGRESFQSLCSKYKMRCKDLSSVLPDDHFGSDGVHVLPLMHDSFRRLLRQAADE